jgi:hypothetical protein
MDPEDMETLFLLEPIDWAGPSETRNKHEQPSSMLFATESIIKVEEEEAEDHQMMKISLHQETQTIMTLMEQDSKITLQSLRPKTLDL